MNKKPRLAWELYERMETSPESFQLLQVFFLTKLVISFLLTQFFTHFRTTYVFFPLKLVANECYRMGQFYYAAKAFDILEKFEASQENWEGKRGACIGVFQLIIAGHEPK